VREHRAWLSVDLPGAKPQDGEQVYGDIGKILAELADHDCLAILAPALDLMQAWDPEMEATLRGPQPLDAVRKLGQVPVLQISGDDPRMIAAVAEARRRWPEFVAAFEQRHPEQNFAVKMRFREGEHEEFMWLRVNALEGNKIYGVLDNEPVALKKVYLGMLLQVDLGELNDWLDMKGGFTVAVFKK
jgi:uncharacterized protein YegJ (DUF2314 family)